MARFHVSSYQWTGGFIGGKPFTPASLPNQSDTFSWPADATVVLKAQVDVVYDDFGPYDLLRFVDFYYAGTITADFAPTEGQITCSLSPIAPIGPTVATGYIQLEATNSGQPTGTFLMSASIMWDASLPTCPSPPGAPGGGCPAGGPVSFGAPDASGVSTFSYSFANPSDPHGIGAGLVLPTSSNSWGISALPSNASVTYKGMTAETPPREVWHATVPAADGSSRLYVNDSDSGEFVPAGPYGTRFSSTSSGFAEKIGNSEVHYDNSGVIQQVVTGEAVHTYTRGQDWVEIEANTALPTKHRYNLQNEDVVSIQTYAQLPGSGWTQSRLLEVGRSSGRIASLTSYPGGRTTSFSYNTDGSLASYQDCSGRTTTLHYEEA